MDDLALYDGFDEELPPLRVEEEVGGSGGADGSTDVEGRERRRGGGPRKRKKTTDVEKPAPDLLTMEYEAYLDAFAKIKAHLNEQVGRKKRMSRGGRRRGGPRRT
eukprot:scaffold1724_cov341-Pavlova_lutheri.AAC.37